MIWAFQFKNIFWLSIYYNFLLDTAGSFKSFVVVFVFFPYRPWTFLLMLRQFIFLVAVINMMLSSIKTSNWWFFINIKSLVINILNFYLDTLLISLFLIISLLFFILLLIQQIITDYLLCVTQCSRHWGYARGSVWALRI